MVLRQIGHGRPLLLVHSLLADSRSMDALASELSSGYRVVIPDLPGYGGSPRSGASIPEVAAELMAALAADGLNHELGVLGNGYGGFVALSLAQQFPEEVRRLVLLDSAAAFPPAGKEGVRAMMDSVREGGMPAVMDIALSRLFPPAYAQAHPGAVASCRAALAEMDAEAFIGMCRNLMMVDLRPGLASVQSRTLVVVGLEDQATPVALARELAAVIPDAQLTELAGCGHAPHIQMPEVVTPLIKAFLA
ncbi:alpha/beta hydrolase [Castellaniella sp. GW247-6E4]|uniref:alpha/beta fold hydrolase n=1 Tax=Castellaniella sp. GW247-6E4 TaxID=3140380 RepID=UPI0033149609